MSAAGAVPCRMNRSGGPEGSSRRRLLTLVLTSLSGHRVHSNNLNQVLNLPVKVGGERREVASQKGLLLSPVQPYGQAGCQ